MHTKHDHEMHLKFETPGNIAHVTQDGLQYFVVYNEYQAGPFYDLLSALVNIYESSQSNGVPYTLVSAQTAQTAHEPHHEEAKTPVHEHTYGEKKPPVTPLPTPEPHVKEVSHTPSPAPHHEAPVKAHKAPYKSGRSGG